MKKTQTQTTAQHLSIALSSLLILLVTLFTRGYALSISTVDDFIDFASNVNSGTNYAGETVYLTNDLDFTGYSPSFVPVGKSKDAKVFRGTFYGNGHVISNLKISSSQFQYLGVFGYSTGTTIKNLIVDDSCSFESNYSNSGVHYAVLGGVLGRCDSYDGVCAIEGCVNMASIKYSGKDVYSSHIGGIAGNFEPVTYPTSITNCLNYGSISSISSYLVRVRIGGITSEIWTGQQISCNNFIKNCLNFGSLSQSGEIVYDLYIGGISGVDKPNIVYENCVNLGAISYNKSLSGIVSAGSISGKSTNGLFENCFWDDSVELNATGVNSSNTHHQGIVESFNSSSISETIGVLDVLNSGGNANWCVIGFDSRGGSVVAPVLVILNNGAKKAIEPLPTPVRVESTFDGWYNDTGFTNRFNVSELNPGNTTLYAKWVTNRYPITFVVDETRNETTQEFGSIISFPENPTKEGFTFDGWNDTIATVPAHNVIIEALWIVNKYTIAFIVDGVEYSKTIQEFGSIITYPENPIKEGFTFDGWYKGSAFKDKADKGNMKVSGNTTLYGRFISTTVRIEFSTKDMSTEGAAKEIKEFVDCTNCFTISEIEDESSVFIIQFKDVNDATHFMDAIHNARSSQKTTFRSVEMISDRDSSFSPELTFSLTLFCFKLFLFV